MNEQEKREKRAKVIAELERVADEANPWKEYPPLRCDILYPLLIDALTLLKAQEPRLVEPNDFENADDYNWLPAWCEERTGAGYWEMILPDALDEKDVRYWTGRPTDEQRAKEPWNGQA